MTLDNGPYNNAYGVICGKCKWESSFAQEAKDVIKEDFQKISDSDSLGLMYKWSDVWICPKCDNVWEKS